MCLMSQALFGPGSATVAPNMAPGESYGVSVRIISMWTIQNPLFWIGFVCAIALGIEILRHLKH